jgi:hypothetical protein
VTTLDPRPDRLARLREAAGDMDEALRDEGFESVGSHAVFVRWQRVSVETLERILGEAEALFDKSRGEGEAERRRIERMIEAGSNALAMAHQATEKARLASVHSAEAIDESIAGLPRRCRERCWRRARNG